MATPSKSRAAKKSAPRSAKQIHQERVTRNAIEDAEAAAATEPTSASEWKQQRTGRRLKLPSGYTALVVNLGMQVFIEEGVIPNSLLEIIIAATDEQKPPSQRVLKEMAASATDIRDVIELANAITVRCVLAPKVNKQPRWTQAHVDADQCNAEDVGDIIPVGHPLRDTNKLYVDEVDLDDKMFIFNWVVGGTHDLEQFRSEQTAALAHVSTSEVVEQASK